MKLYNSLTRQIESFEPINPPEVRLYACGPTVYDYTHIGHLRKYVMDDVLIRVLEYFGFDVKFVQNITDVGHLVSDEDTGEDKMEKGTRKYNLTAQALALKFEDYFFYSMDLMNNQRPDVSCRATEHIQEQIELVEQLEAKGFTYVIEGDGVYFDTSKLDDYGQLAQLEKKQLEEGARVAKNEAKRNPTDFALWKFERDGENRQMAWKSPWSDRSFPGWHIECSAMSMHYLGEQFDVHTGGEDHISVHHPNEIAQAEAATGKKPFVKYWIHHRFMMVDGEKMSKSLENFYTIDDVLKRNINPMAMRLLFLGSHYRSQLNFTWDSLQAAAKSYERLSTQLGQFKFEAKEHQIEQLSAQAQKYKQQFVEFISDDLRTPEAVALMWEVLGSELDNLEKLSLILEFDQVFGLRLGEVEPQSEYLSPDELEPEVLDLLAKRQKARQEKNWQRSDELRDELAAMGLKVIDLEGEQRLKPSLN